MFFLNFLRTREKDTMNTIIIGGVIYWKVNEQLHREDGPAIERANGDREWYQHDKRHRLDGPAVENANGTLEWWRDGNRHRDDGPAVEHANGTLEWYRHNKRHRLDGPAVEHANGALEWWRDGNWHRDDGPATISADGTRFVWYTNGVMGRADGPTIVIRRNPTVISWDSEVLDTDVELSLYWYNGSVLHRDDDMPALVVRIRLAGGNILTSSVWRINGKLHRENGPASITTTMRPNGDVIKTSMKWCKYGYTHREDGKPAIIDNGSFIWMECGRYHRDGDMPAVVRADGTRVYFIRGRQRRFNGGPCIIYPNGDRGMNTKSRRIPRDEWEARSTGMAPAQECALRSAVAERVNTGAHFICPELIARIVQMTI